MYSEMNRRAAKLPAEDIMSIDLVGKSEKESTNNNSWNVSADRSFEYFVRMFGKARKHYSANFLPSTLIAGGSAI